MNGAQDSLFDAPVSLRVPVGEAPRQRMAARVRQADPDTSWEAAASISGLAATVLEKEILDAFRTKGPMTDEELTLGPMIHRYAPTVISCRSRLYRKGHVVDTGRGKLTSRGRPAIVWGAADA